MTLVWRQLCGFPRFFQGLSRRASAFRSDNALFSAAKVDSLPQSSVSWCQLELVMDRGAVLRP